MEPKSEQNPSLISRRHTLSRSSILSTALACGLTACGGGGSDSSPAISPPPSPPPPPPPPPPAGSVIFTGGDGVSGIRLYAVEDDGTGHRALSDTLRPQQRGLVPFEVSPDEVWVAFIGNPEGANQLYVNEVINRDGSGLISVSDGVGNKQVSINFEWSPDSTRIAFSAGLSALTPSTVYIGQADGSGVSRISDPLITDIGQIAYVPN